MITKDQAEKKFPAGTVVKVTIDNAPHFRGTAGVVDHYEADSVILFNRGWHRCELATSTITRLG